MALTSGYRAMVDLILLYRTGSRSSLIPLKFHEVCETSSPSRQSVEFEPLNGAVAKDQWPKLHRDLRGSAPASQVT